MHVKPKNGVDSWGTERIFIVKYDKTNPNTSANVTSGTAGNNDWYTSDVEVTITPSDTLSGIASTTYCIDQTDTCSPVTSYTAPLSITSEGQNYVRYSSTDNVGNIQSTQSFGVKIDKTNPTVNSITSVAGDVSSPYFDNTDNSSTLVIYDASADVSSCRWSETDQNTVRLQTIVNQIQIALWIYLVKVSKIYLCAVSILPV